MQAVGAPASTTLAHGGGRGRQPRTLLRARLRNRYPRVADGSPLRTVRDDEEGRARARLCPSHEPSSRRTAAGCGPRTTPTAARQCIACFRLRRGPRTASASLMRGRTRRARRASRFRHDAHDEAANFRRDRRRRRVGPHQSAASLPRTRPRRDGVRVRPGAHRVSRRGIAVARLPAARRAHAGHDRPRSPAVAHGSRKTLSSSRVHGGRRARGSGSLSGRRRRRLPAKTAGQRRVVRGRRARREQRRTEPRRASPRSLPSSPRPRY